MQFSDLWLVVLVVLASGGLLFYFVMTGISFERRGRIVDTAPPKGTPHDKIARELHDLDLPPQKLQETAKRVTALVDQEVHKQTETVRVEMRNSYEKIIEAKDQTVKRVKTEYEVVQKNYQKMGKQKKQTEAVVRNMAKGLIVVNDSGEVLFVNPVAEKILGVKPQSLIGKSITTAQGDHVITMVDDDGAEERNVAALSQNTETKEILKESTAVIEGDSGQTKGMVSILTGVTQQKKVDDYKTEFVANISHEFRTPLICIQKSILAIQDELQGMTEHQRNYFDIAIRNARRLEKMVNDILDVSKIQSGKMILRHELFSAQSFIKEVRNTFSVWGRDKHIEIIEQVPEEPLPLEADQERLGQVLINLVSNSMKFTPRGGTITVDAKIVDEKNASQKEDIGLIQIGVRDTGPGLSEEDQKKIFKKFSHASTRALEGEKGSGLGLTIAKEIVELHGGRIWLESQEGKGSYFAFVIPQRPSKTQAEAKGNPPSGGTS